MKKRYQRSLIRASEVSFFIKDLLKVVELLCIQMEFYRQIL